jgi:hypothetical protein
MGIEITVQLLEETSQKIKDMRSFAEARAYVDSLAPDVREAYRQYVLKKWDAEKADRERLGRQGSGTGYVPKNHF